MIATSRGVRSKPLLLMALLLLVTACASSDGGEGTTRQSATEASAPGVLPTVGNAADPNEASVGPARDIGSAQPQTAPTGSSADTQSSKPSPGTASAGAAPIPTGAGAQGVTDKTIEVGLWYYNTDAAQATVLAAGGGNDAGSQDVSEEAMAVAKYVNAQGGVAGREVVPVLYEYNAAAFVTKSGQQQEAQKSCATWTEDHDVFAMMQLHGGINLECALDAKTVLIASRGTSEASVSASMFAEEYSELYYAPSLLLSERRETALVNGLWDQGYFGSDPKVGVLIQDSRAVREGVARGMLPALRRFGIEPVIQIVYPHPVDSPWQNYTLQLQSAGVTHILMSGTTGTYVPVSFAMRSAESQRYYPKWGVASDNNPTGAADFGSPRDQLVNAYGVGWQPFYDVGDAKAAESPNSDLCDQVLVDAGSPKTSARLYCEGLFFLKFALDRAPEVSRSGMKAAMSSVGDQYSSVWTIGGKTSFTPDRHDGPVIYRDVGFDEPCDCFTYTSAPKPLP